MKTCAYSSLFLEDAMNNIGTMLDCAVHATQCDQDILKAEAQTVFALSRVLGWAPEMICG